MHSFFTCIFFIYKKKLLNSKNSAAVSLVLNFKLNKNHDRDMYWLIFFLELFMLKWKIEGHFMSFPSLCLSPSATFFPSKFKCRTQYLNNGDGLSKHVSPLLLYKFFTKVHFYLECFKSFVLMFGFSFRKGKLFITHLT